MSVSKKVRFNVFKRDGFICQYCGRTPPAIVLECDHIHPRAKGGGDEIDNLLTACLECNRGKSDGLLTVAPETIQQKSELLAEKEAQIKAFRRLQKQQRAREDAEVVVVQNIFHQYFPGQDFTPAFRLSVRRNFVPHLSADDIEYAMHRACTKRGDHAEGAIRYFCGTCWGIRRTQGTHG